MNEEIVKQRLIIFCSELDADLAKVRQALSELSDQHGLAELELEPIDGPEGLTQSGWMTLQVSRAGTTAVDLARLGSHIEELVQSCSRVLGEDVLGVFVDGNAYGRACLQSPGGFPRSSEGEIFHVLRQAAGWVEADAVQLLRYFSAGTSRGTVGNQLDLSEVQVSAEEKEPDTELDDDDKFVEAKLKQARELMERYLSARK
jgi:hypothetical protein